MPATISRAAYASIFGPTVSDRVRLADTSLFIQVERDLTVYGEEIVFGANKVVRDGMGQGQTCWAEGAPDTIITNALIFDHSGVTKADVSIRDGIIGTIGKAGNPATQPGVNIPIGPGTAIISGEGRILTAGGVAIHVPFIGSQQIDEALQSGFTTMFGGGIGPAARSAVTPGAWLLGKMIDSADAFSVNLGFTGKGAGATRPALDEQVIGGACALSLDEVWGSTPAAIDSCLSAADDHDIQVTLEVDAVHEAGFIDETIAAIKGRTIHAAAHGTADDFMLAGLDHVLPSTADHGANGDLMAAEHILHDTGALSMMRACSRPGSHAGAIVRHAWQVADAMNRRRGPLSGDGSPADNVRAKRYVAKYTINPAIAFGVADHVGSVEMGKLADLVLWSPAFFGVQPDLVLKGGVIAAAPRGGRGHAAFGASAGARLGACLTFVSQAAIDKNLGQRLRTQRRLVAVRKTRGDIGKASMIYNDATPTIRAHATTNDIEIDGERPVHEPGRALPMAQRYSLF